MSYHTPDSPLRGPSTADYALAAATTLLVLLLLQRAA